LKFIILLVQIC